MMPKPSAGTAEMVRELAALNAKVAAGIVKLSAIRDEDVEIATTPKDQVFRSDKITLYRYRPLTERRVGTPVLMVYSLIGRHTMTDLQEDLVLTITPLDFHADEHDEKLEHGFLNVWARSLTGADVDRMIDVWGVLPGEFMGAVLSMLTPIRSITKYNLDLLEVIDDYAKLLNFLRMEKWLGDRPHHPGEAAKQWLKDLYQENKLIENTWELGGRPVDLRQVTMPVLNIYAQADHIVPPPISRVLDGKLGTDDYTELGLPGGHIGMFVSSRSQGIVGKGIVDWLVERYG